MTNSGNTRPSVALRISGAIAVVIIMVSGIFILGRLASNDVMAMVLTTLFFGVLFAGIGFLAWRQRAWLLPLGIPFVAVGLIAGVILGRPLVFDDVVDEQVVVADDTASTGDDASSSAGSAAKNVELSSGSFEALSHPGEGTATLIRTASGEVKLTFTDFSTDNGPDIRVYLSRDTDSSGRGSSFVDLGAMKGNKGNQQYTVPADVDLESVDAIVLWCRAFDVGFTQAPLTSA